MSATTPAPAVGIAGQTVSTRVVSIDIFRGITMAVMIFVNDLDSVHGLTKWTYHMAANVDAMTYVDMVFPAFLFIVGMALPIAVRQRLKRNPSLPALWVHIVLRSLALLVLGLILANAERGDPARMHLNPNAWALLGLLGCILLWNVYTGVSRRVVLWLRTTGAVLIVLMFAIFRRTTHTGGEGWIRFSYPEILGLIGLTYFAVCLLYIPTRRWQIAPLAWFVLLVAYNAASILHWVPFQHASMYEWPFSNGCLASLVMAGVVVSNIFLGEHRWKTPGQKIQLALLMAIVTFIAGWLLMPLGISKIRATPTWALWTIAACCALFSLLYWLCDVQKRTAWAWLVQPAGSNTLLTYLLPDIYYFLAGLTGLEYLLGHWNAGWPGIIRAVCFTIAILLIARLVTKARLRMQL
jgi:heparan-alpha-glucosaminide N-acetyltransferase